MLPSEHFWGYAVFVWPVGVGAVEQEGGDDIGVAVGSSKVQRGRARGADDGGRGVSVLVVGVASWQSAMGEREQ